MRKPEDIAEKPVWYDRKSLNKVGFHPKHPSWDRWADGMDIFNLKELKNRGIFKASEIRKGIICFAKRLHEIAFLGIVYRISKSVCICTV